MTNRTEENKIMAFSYANPLNYFTRSSFMGRFAIAFN